MDERDEQGQDEAAATGGDGSPLEAPTWQLPPTPPPSAGPPVRAASSSPMPLSMPPFVQASEEPAPAPPAEEPTRVEPPASWWGAQDPGTALPGTGAPPSGGQPPYLPPYGYGWPPGGLPYGEPQPAAPRPSGHRRAFAALGVVALLASGLGAGLGVALAGTSEGGRGSSSAQSTPEAPGNSLSSTGAKLSVSAIANAVKPAVVDIRTVVASPVGQSESAAGTGMILTSSGEVLTNNHVVEHAMRIRVYIQNRSGSYAAKVIGVNPTEDVALLQIQGVSNLPSVSLGDSSTAAVGDPVVAIGNALGLGGTPSVVSGQVSAIGRTITASDVGLQSETLHNLIQTTAPIQPGDSGGPLVNAQAKVIGMDTAAASADTGSTVGFAIPINEARTIVQQMENHQAVGGNILGASPFLGVYENTAGSGVSGGATSPFGGLPGFGGTPSTTPAVSGVSLGGVVGSSPAETAGLQAGDVITSIDGQATPTWSALKQIVQAKAPGDRISVSFVDSNGASHTVTVQLAALPQ